MTRAFWQPLVMWREVLLENMLPAFVAPSIWMTLVSFALGAPYVRKLGLFAVGPLGALVSGVAALIWVTTGRRSELTTPRAMLVALGTIAGGALACQLARDFYEARWPGLVGPVDLAVIGAVGAAFTGGLYGFRVRRFRRRLRPA